MIDAVVVGSGPNGLVAANLLADRGWKVLVCEGAPTIGGAVRSGEVTEPGFTSDLYSAFYPLAVASPVIRDLRLDRWGLRWTRAPLALGHPVPGVGAAVIAPEVADTAAALDELCPGDGRNWFDFVARWRRLGPPALRALLSPFPPVRASLRLLRRAGRDDLLWLARTGMTSARRLGEELFAGEGPRLLLAGSALHTDLTPESAGSGIFGWILTGLAQEVGFPVPVGGAGELTASLARRLTSLGGEIRCDAPVTRVLVEDGAARGVVAGGETIRVERAVLASAIAPALYGDLLDGVELPDRVRRGIGRWEPGAGTVKVDWSVRGRIPWRDERLSRAGTVHLIDSLDELSRYSADLSTATVPNRPFVVVGQMTTSDPHRSPPGTESAWAYTHVPQRPRHGSAAPSWTGDAVATVVDRIEAMLEEHAPGFRDRIGQRYVQGPCEMQAANPNLIGGDLNGGTAQLHQQVVLRPFLGLGRAETFVRGLYLAGASAHPGGAVHGAPGANAARAAVAHDRLGSIRARLTGAG